MLSSERSRRAGLIYAAAWLTVLAACGGGGSDGGGGDGDGGGCIAGGGATTTGFVPAAPALGPLLYEKAEPLRPLRAGSSWVYRSVDYSINNILETTVRQTAGVANEVIETDSSHPAGSTRLSLDGATGAVLFSTTLDLGAGIAPVAIAGIELPSPVRQNDQHVLIDTRIPDIGIDVDGDNDNDAADFASWRVVVGNEQVNLPNLAGPVTALRVDTFVAVRMVLTTCAAATVERSQQSTWYVPGIGIVRDTVASSDPSRALDSQDMLLGYDGLDAGWGYLMREPVPMPAFSGAAALSLSAQVPGGVLVSDGYQMLSFARDGSLRARRTFNAGRTPRGPLLRLSTGVRLFTGSFPIHDIYHLSDDGAPLNDTPVQLNLEGGRPGQFPFVTDERIAAFTGADRFWVAWQRSYLAAPSQPADETVLQLFDEQGAALGEEMRFPNLHTAGSGSLALVARADGVVLTWQEFGTNGGISTRLVSVGNDGLVTFSQSIADTMTATFERSVLRPLVDDDTLWMIWNGPTAASNALVPHGLRMDDRGQIVGTGSDIASLHAATIDPFDSEIATESWPSRMAASSGSWFVTGGGYGKLFPDDHVDGRWVTCGEYAPGDGALPGAVQEVMRVRIPAESAPSAPPIVFDDRVLLLLTKWGQAIPTVVWRRRSPSLP